MQIIPEHEYSIQTAEKDSSNKSLKSKKTSIFQFHFLKPKINDALNEAFVENDRKKSFFDKIEGIKKSEILAQVVDGRFNDNQLIDLAILILQKSEERTRNDIKILSKCLEIIKFFKQKQTQSVSLIPRCAKVLVYKAFKAGEIVFLEGTQGNLFYVILKGTVSVCKFVGNNTDDKFQKNVIFPIMDKKTLKNALVFELKLLGKGESFGELALINNKPRQATVVCKEDCEFAILEKKDFEEILKEIEKEDLNQKLKDFSEFTIFKKFNLNLLRSIYLDSSQKDFTKNSIVFCQNDRSSNFYLIKSGEFELYINLSPFHNNIDENLELELAVLKGQRKNHLPKDFPLIVLNKGYIFGHEDLINSAKRKYSVRCTSLSGSLYIISKENFLTKIYPNEPTAGFFDLKTKELNEFLSKRLYSRLKTLKEETKKPKFNESDIEMPKKEKDIFFLDEIFKDNFDQRKLEVVTPKTKFRLDSKINLISSNVLLSNKHASPRKKLFFDQDYYPSEIPSKRKQITSFEKSNKKIESYAIDRKFSAPEKHSKLKIFSYTCFDEKNEKSQKERGSSRKSSSRGKLLSQSANRSNRSKYNDNNDVSDLFVINKSEKRKMNFLKDAIHNLAKVEFVKDKMGYLPLKFFSKEIRSERRLNIF